MGYFTSTPPTRQVGQEDHAVIEIGQSAPPFTLRDQNRNEVSLDELGGRPTLVVFMPFAFTRVCGSEMCDIRDNLSKLSGADANVVVITCDTAPVNKAWAEAEGFDFPIVSDFWPHGAVTSAYGCFNEALGVAHRATFVIDAGGTVRDVIASDGLRHTRPFASYVESLAAL